METSTTSACGAGSPSGSGGPVGTVSPGSDWTVSVSPLSVPSGSGSPARHLRPSRLRRAVLRPSRLRPAVRRRGRWASAGRAAGARRGGGPAWRTPRPATPAGTARRPATVRTRPAPRPVPRPRVAARRRRSRCGCRGRGPAGRPPRSAVPRAAATPSARRSSSHRRSPAEHGTGGEADAGGILPVEQFEFDGHCGFWGVAGSGRGWGAGAASYPSCIKKARPRGGGLLRNRERELRRGAVRGQAGLFAADHFGGHDVPLAGRALGQFVHQVEHAALDHAPQAAGPVSFSRAMRAIS